MKDVYETPLCGRYASRRMQQIFSPDFKFSTWRRLWLALAESEQALGLPITDEQLEQMRAHLDDVDYERAAFYERELRHDVMSHIRAFGEQCPAAAPIIHLGATSCYVGDNTDIIQMREGLLQIRGLLVGLIAALADFAEANRDVPTLAWTHYQAAQPTTLGKRACMWTQDLLFDLDRLENELSSLRLLGCKGATGTGASILALFDGDADKVRRLEEMICEKMGFDGALPISGQTYSRKIDYFILSVLSGIAQSAAKMSVDLRLMAHMKEFDEPFETSQVGSSAMAYKRNPMRSERVVSLARYVMNLSANAADTAANQWLERTLDDSANRRISLPEAFLATDGLLRLAANVIRGGRPYPKQMEKHLNEELPFMATENILMLCVKRGGSRQELHEAIRQHAQASAAAVKLEGKENTLLEDILADERFGLTRAELDEILDVRKFVGLAPQQAQRFVADVVRPRIARYGAQPGGDDAITV